MLFNTKIKWTIDASCSEIFFKIKYLLLTGVNNISEKITCHRISGSEMCVRTEEITASIDYNLVIFEEKNQKQFWKRETISGLLIFKNSGQNVLITLYRMTNTFDDYGRAAATYSVKGKLGKEEFDPGIDGINVCAIIRSELLFEGIIQLIQKRLKWNARRGNNQILSVIKKTTSS